MTEPTITKYPNVEIAFYEDKHRYEVRKKWVNRHGELWSDWWPADGVTSVLGKVFDKSGPMAWWGMGLGAKGVIELLDREPVLKVLNADTPELSNMLTKHKLTVNHQRDSAADRGTAVHTFIERYAKTGRWPAEEDIPYGQEGYIDAFDSWLRDYNPVFSDSEVVVGSAEHSYAGTYDMRIVDGDGRIGLGDVKTGKRLYDSVFAQLGAYELASIECGLGATNFQFAVRLGADGQYEYEESQVEPEEVWLPCLEAYRAQKQIADARKKVAA